MLLDCHVHTEGTETAAEIVAALDRAGTDRAILFAPYHGGEVGYPGTGMEDANRWLGGIARELPDRVIGFCWIEPTLPGAVQELERCIGDYGLAGVKMIPNHWYPTDKVAFPVYEEIQELGVPVIFHAGILYGYEDGSRFCQPVLYEALINFPGVRFALAHLAWPWVDECLATYGRFRAQYRTYHGKRPAVREMQMWIDLTPGTPPAWRADALRKALAFAGPEHLIWGSDSTPHHAEGALRIREQDRQILTSQLGLPADAQEEIFGGNLERFLAPRGE